MAFDATVSGTSATSFITVAQFRAYCATRPNASTALVALLAGDDEDIEPYLVAATNDITYNVAWSTSRVGTPTVPSQRLRFPAYNVVTPNNNGTYYSNSAIPDFIVDAVSEQALAHLDGYAFTQSTTSSISELKADVVEIKYNREETQPEDQQTVVETVRRILAFWATNFADEEEGFRTMLKVHVFDSPTGAIGGDPL